MIWKTVPICTSCWYFEEDGRRLPIPVKEEMRQTEICYYCAAKTKSGIYVRRDINAQP